MLKKSISRKFIDTVIISDEIDISKPDPEISCPTNRVFALRSGISLPITNAMIENGRSLGAHPVASAPIKPLLECFCLYPLGADKFNSSRAEHGVVVDFPAGLQKCRQECCGLLLGRG